MPNCYKYELWSDTSYLQPIRAINFCKQDILHIRYLWIIYQVSFSLTGEVNISHIITFLCFNKALYESYSNHRSHILKLSIFTLKTLVAYLDYIMWKNIFSNILERNEISRYGKLLDSYSISCSQRAMLHFLYLSIDTLIHYTHYAWNIPYNKW